MLERQRVLTEAATSNEALGPYNHELIEISMLTHNEKQMAIIGTVLEKRLSSGLETVRKPKRAHSWSSGHDSRHEVSRSASFSSREKVYLQLLKTLSTILYLMQNGSESFVKWIRSVYTQLVVPLKFVMLPKRFKESLQFKVNSITHYCESEEDMKKLRVNIHKLRSDLSAPGLKRSRTLDRMHEVLTQHEPVNVMHNVGSPLDSSSSPSRDSFNGNDKRRIASLDIPRTYHNMPGSPLAPLVEESRESLLKATSSHSNNPFYRM